MFTFYRISSLYLCLNTLFLIATLYGDTLRLIANTLSGIVFSQDKFISHQVRSFFMGTLPH